MAGKVTIHNRMRIWHRYLGFFLVGIMAIYALSGVIMIFRSTNFLKQKKVQHRTVKPNLSAEELSQAIRFGNIKFDSVNGDTAFFRNGYYNKTTGEVELVTMQWPRAIDKLTQLHKASTNSPLFFLNVFFGVALFFFVLSSFWMFLPGTSIFKKGLYFTAAGVALTIIMLLI